MWIKKSILCLYFLIFRHVTCYSIKISEPAKRSPQLHRHAKKLAEMCFTKNSSSVVISEDLLGNDWDPGGNSLIVIDREFKKQITGFISSYPTYVLSFDTMENLKTTMEHLQQSKLWSIKSPFLIVESESRCSNAAKVLEFMWQQDLLASYYMCSDENLTNVFTLNPFKSYAPAPWVQMEKLSDNNTESTLFALKYSRDKKICESITFDKTQELNGHEINVVFFFDFKNVPPDKLNIELSKFRGSWNRLRIVTVETLIAYVKARRVYNFFPTSIIDRSLSNGYLKELVGKMCDIIGKTVQLANTNYQYMDIITEYDEVEFSILTKKSNYLEAVSQVTCNYQFLFLTIFVLMFIAMIVMINNKFDMSGSILYIMSLTAGMGVLTPLDRLSMRIIYIFGFIFIFTVMPDFQGQVSAILSKPLRRNVETLKDLYDNKYHVFYDGTLENDMVNEKLWVTDEEKQYLKKSNFSQLSKCAVEAQFNAKIACIQLRAHQLQYSSILKNLHVSKDVIFKKYFILWSRKNWSIKDKVDRASLFHVEVGVVFPSKDQSDKYHTEKMRKMKRIEESSHFEYIDFDTLLLSYMIVFGLLLWGLVVFGFELLFHKYETRRRQALIRRHHRRFDREQEEAFFFP